MTRSPFLFITVPLFDLTGLWPVVATDLMADIFPLSHVAARAGTEATLPLLQRDDENNDCLVEAIGAVRWAQRRAFAPQWVFDGTAFTPVVEGVVTLPPFPLLPQSTATLTAPDAGASGVTAQGAGGAALSSGAGFSAPSGVGAIGDQTPTPGADAIAGAEVATGLRSETTIQAAEAAEAVGRAAAETVWQ